MKLSGMVKSSLVDYPGLVSCVLFVSGCNYNCFYCHNRSLLDGTAPLLLTYTVEEFLIKRAGLLDGVVITGGEPTLQSGLKDYIKKLRALGYQVKLDTNGSAPQTVSELLSEELCDYYAVDYKAPAARYAEICGGAANPGAVLETIALLKKSGMRFEVRTTVIPQLTLQDLQQMARELPVLPRYILNRYRMPEQYLPIDKQRIEEKAYTQSQITAFAKELKEIQPNTVL